MATEVPFKQTLSDPELIKPLSSIYGLDDPEDWCLWEATVLALEHFNSEQSWCPPPGLLLNQIEWRMQAKKSIYGKIGTGAVGIAVALDHLTDQNISVNRVYNFGETVYRDIAVLNPALANVPVESVGGLDGTMLPGFVNYKHPVRGTGHIEFMVDLEDIELADTISRLGYVAKQAVNLCRKS